MPGNAQRDDLAVGDGRRASWPGVSAGIWTGDGRHRILVDPGLFAVSHVEALDHLVVTLPRENIELVAHERGRSIAQPHRHLPLLLEFLRPCCRRFERRLAVAIRPAPLRPIAGQNHACTQEADATHDQRHSSICACHSSSPFRPPPRDGAACISTGPANPLSSQRAAVRAMKFLHGASGRSGVSALRWVARDLVSTLPCRTISSFVSPPGSYHAA